TADDDDDTAEGDDDTADGDDDTAAGDDDDATTGDDDTAPPDIAPQGISMVGIPSGSFPMGCAEGKSGCGTDESPVHSVTLTHAFWMSATEVTQGQWQALMGNNPSPFVSCGSDCPVDSITWLEALSFANALSAAEGLAECYSVVGDSVSINSSTGSPYDCTGYRLPTEAEWEYAARAGAESLYAGGNEAADVAWHSGNSGGASHPVGTRQPNAWGLYDMSGNVWEWIWDLYDSDYYDVSPGTNPEGPSSGSVRVIRGGSWDDDSSCVTVCNRDSYGDPNQQSDFLGLRVTRTSPTSEAQAQ
ncbi:MAG TPA: hypothetical protein DIU15_09830, partial [Deltaproteobacteria bacterium]|nr:hypothetical protein [Deltaproteobacteria bacterium]